MTGEYDMAEVLRALGLGTSAAGRKRGMAMFGKKNIQFPSQEDKTNMLSRQRPAHLDSVEGILEMLRGLPKTQRRNTRISGQEGFIRKLSNNPEFMALTSYDPARASGPGSRDGLAQAARMRELMATKSKREGTLKDRIGYDLSELNFDPGMRYNPVSGGSSYDDVDPFSLRSPELSDYE